MNNSGNIRNFVIISHIDHGKSTLADRFLEITKTVDVRQMKAQFLDSLESERERGITIKMAPVRMNYELGIINYVFNMIDTPGHSDFSYEVSRALTAVEGAILLVDITQGIQAQTLAKFHAAQKLGLKIIGAVNKVDLISSEEQLNRRIKDLADLIGCEPEKVYKISAKTGKGVEELLKAIIEKIPSSHQHKSIFNHHESVSQALIFDSFYDDHKGIIASTRIFSGEFNINEEAYLIVADEKFKMKEIGYFLPQLKSIGKLSVGEIGYIATGLKDPGKIKIGDTIINFKSHPPVGGSNLKSFALEGYDEPKPVVFVSFYPENSNQYDDLKKAFGRLKLNDSSLKFEADFNEVLGRGFKVGFLGKLHFEITAERLEKEFDIKTINSFPSVAYKINNLIIDNPAYLPDDIKEILEPMINLEIISPSEHLGGILQLKEIFRMENIATNNLGAEGIILITARMPLAELISDFDDRLKSVSEGFASFNYELADYQKAELEKMEILVANAPVAGLVRVVPRKKIEYEARKMTEKLKNILPRQQFSQAIQAVAGGRIIARETIPAMKKDVTGYLYGGDRTRKMKLWKKQKKGKKKLLSMAQVRIPAEVFKKIIK
ncbi:MAG: translation elongation factor 4 [Patescibacteria group bacterium]